MQRWLLDDRFSRFKAMCVTDRRTDRRTELLYQYRALYGCAMVTRNKNVEIEIKITENVKM